MVSYKTGISLVGNCWKMLDFFESRKKKLSLSFKKRLPFWQTTGESGKP